MLYEQIKSERKLIRRKHFVKKQTNVNITFIYTINLSDNM